MLHGPFDEQWLIPDQRLIDAARPELWRVADEEQVFAVETAPASPGPQLLATALLPALPCGRPAGSAPSTAAPAARNRTWRPACWSTWPTASATPPTRRGLLAWIAAATRPGAHRPAHRRPELWTRGVELGHRALWLMRRDGARPKLPGGRRPYVRAPLPGRPLTAALRPRRGVPASRRRAVSPRCRREAWDFEVGGVRVLEQWFADRTATADPGTLEAIRPAAWPQTWTSELLELITVLALLAELGPRRAESHRDRPDHGGPELRKAGVLPVPRRARRPASVLDHHEEGPEGQFALL